MADASHHRPLLALLIRLCAAAVMAMLSALVKLASDRGIHLLEIIFWRQVVTVPALLGWVAARTGGVRALATRRPLRHFQRAVYGLTGMMLSFGGVTLLPLTEATVMNFTAPIWAVILAMLLLKETIGIWRWSAVMLGFVGILVITQPGDGHIPLLGALMALGGAFMMALISIQIADLNRTENPVTIVFYFAAFSSPLLGLALPFVGTRHDAAEWGLLLGMGAAGLLCQLLITASLRFGSVASVIVMDYSALFWATLYGWLLFATLPPASTWLGAPLIVMAGLIITWRAHHLSRRVRAGAVEGT